MNIGDLRTTRRIGMRSGTASWYKIGNQVAGQATRIDIYDEIGYWGVMAADFVAELRQVRGDIELHINSPGGDVFDGLTIYNNLVQHHGDISVIIDGLAASAASFIAQAASKGKLRIVKTATMMIHNGFGLVIGDANDMRKMADVLDDQTENIASIYADRSGQPVAKWRALMNEESWFRGPAAVEVGLADEVLDLTAAPTNQWDLTVFRNAPSGRAVNAAPGGSGLEGHGAYGGRHEHEHPAYDGAGNTHSHGHLHEGDASHKHDHGEEWAGTANAATVPYVGTTQTRHEPMTGQHHHDHAAMSDTDHDDGIHAHQHSHAGDASHDHHAVGEGAAGDGHGAPASAPGNQAGETFADLLPEWMRAGNVANAAYDDSEWDGNAAMTAASNADDPGKAFAAICAGRRSGPADERASWALPHHKAPGSPPNRAGVNNAKARLSQTQGLTNSSAAESHLDAHQKLWADSDDATNTATGTWQDAASRVGAQMAELLRGRQPVADAPQGGE